MVRTLTFALGLSLLLARQASAASVTPTDLDTFPLGASIAGPMTDPFTTAMPPPPTNGSLTSQVYFDGSQYVYTHTVTPSIGNNFVFNTEFQVPGFTGVAGWSYGDALSAGGAGSGIDFQIANLSGQLSWVGTLGGTFGGWDAFEAVTFFFVSTLPPTIRDYNLINLEAGTSQNLAPVPEPGSIALFGSGLAGLYAAVRRRRNQLS